MTNTENQKETEQKIIRKYILEKIPYTLTICADSEEEIPEKLKEELFRKIVLREVRP